MTGHEQTHGRGTIETRDGEEIPVIYDMIIEYENAPENAAPEPTRMSGRLRIVDNPWLEATVISEGYILVLQDGTRLRVRVDTGGRGSETLPFRAALLDD